MADWRLRSDDEVLRARSGKNPDRKQCRGPCQQELPREAFDVDSGKPDGLKSWCKQCRQAKRKHAAGVSLGDFLARVDDRVLASLRGTQPGGTNLPHQVQALEAILALFGGIQGFAMYYTANCLAAPPGSQTRERALSKVIGMIEACSDSGKVSKPRELLTDEELDALIDERAARLRLAQHTIEGVARESA